MISSGYWPKKTGSAQKATSQLAARISASGREKFAFLAASISSLESVAEEIVWPERKPLEQMTPKEILEIVKEAGIVGMGGRRFPHPCEAFTEGTGED